MFVNPRMATLTRVSLRFRLVKTPAVLTEPESTQGNLLVRTVLENSATCTGWAAEAWSSISKELQKLSPRTVQLDPTPSGLVLGTKLGIVELTPGEGRKTPGVSKNCERVWRAALGKFHRAAGSAILSGPVCHESGAAEMTSPTSQLCRPKRSDCSKESCRRMRAISTSPSKTVRSCKSSFTDVFQIAWSSAHRRLVSGPRNRAKESLSDEDSAF